MVKLSALKERKIFTTCEATLRYKKNTTYVKQGLMNKTRKINKS